MLNALSSHSKVASVQQHGLNALKNLVCVDAHRRVVLRELGLTVVLTALKNHPRKQEVQEHGLGVLANLATDGGNKFVACNCNSLLLMDDFE